MKWHGARAVTSETRSRRLGWYRWGVALANFGTNAAFFVPLQNLLPRMIENATPSVNKGVALGLIGGMGALVAMVVNPIAGHFSDKRVRRDGRRGWLVAGLLLGAVSLVALSWQHSIVGITICWAVTQLSLNLLYAPLVASVVDHIPQREQGSVWGYIGVARGLGLVAGFGLLAVPPTTTAGSLVRVAVLYVICVLPLTVMIRAVPLPSVTHRRAMTKVTVLVTELARDFRAFFVVRMLMTLASAISLTYLLYYLQEVIHYLRATEGQAILIGMATLTTIIAAVMTGKLSDKTGHRRRYIAGATWLMVAAGVLLALFPSWPITVLSALAIGVTMGVYASVGQALSVHILPDSRSAGRDLGVMNVGSVLPQIVGPLLASWLLYLGMSYRGLFMFAAILGLAALAALRGVHDDPPAVMG